MKYRLILLALFALVAGCGSPYLEKGFKSEQDYDLAEAGGLSPRGVEMFKSVGVTTPQGYREAAQSMKSSGYSSSNDPNDVYMYAKDRFDGQRAGRSASAQRTVRVEEERQAERRKRELQAQEAQRKAAQQEAENRKKREEEAAQKAKEEKNRQALLAEWDRLDRVGPAFCAGVRNISGAVAEKIASGIRSDPGSIRFNRSTYLSPRQSLREGGIGAMIFAGAFMGMYDGGRLAPTCRITVYSGVGPVYCDVEAAHISAGVAVNYKSCQR